MKKIIVLIITLLCTGTAFAVSHTTYSGISQVPSIQMQSTSVWAGQRNDVLAAGTQSHSGFYTSASAVTGGVTTYDSYNPAEDGYGAGGPRYTPGFPGGKPTPIGDGWDVWLFMAVLGTGYAFVARRREELKAKS